MSDVDILGRVERRRVWTAQEKAALLAEIDAAGGKVRLVARRHRISEECTLQLAIRTQSGRRGDGSAGEC